MRPSVGWPVMIATMPPSCVLSPFGPLGTRVAATMFRPSIMTMLGISGS
jgi:hypothetical protein